MVQRGTHNHPCLVINSLLQCFKVNHPIRSRRGPRSCILWRTHGNISDLPTGHLDVADVLVKEGLKDNDFIPRLDEAHEGTKHALIGSSGNGHLRVRIDNAAKEGRVSIGDGLL